MNDLPLKNAGGAGRRNGSSTEDLQAIKESVDRSDRANDPRDNDRRDISADDEERLALYRESLLSSVLPNLPKIPGYHLIWLTTTNSKDTIPQRMQLGYEPVKPEDVPGYDHLVTGKGAEQAGLITVNEMVAFKIREELYQRFMSHSHHNAPRQEEEAIKRMVDDMGEEAARYKAKMTVEEGTQELGRFVRPQRFT